MDTQDFGILKAHFGEGGLAAIPEPATLSLLVLGGIALLRMKRLGRSRLNGLVTALFLCVATVAAGGTELVHSTASLSQRRYSIGATSVGHMALFAGGRTYGADFSSAVDVYDAAAGTWSTAALSQARGSMGATTAGGKAFFGGGYAVTGGSQVLDVYDATADTWTTAALSEARYELAATTVGGKAMFAGGVSDTTGPRATVDIYDVAGGTWSKASLSVGRNVLAATAVDGKAIFAGGYGESGATDAVDIYDIDTDTWTTASLSEARWGLAATTVGSKAIFAGGNTGSGPSTVVDIYDAVTGQWSATSISQGGSRGTATTVGDLALFAGGSVGTDTVAVYDALADSWDTVALSQARWWMSATSVDGQALFAGGYDRITDVVDIYTIPEPATVVGIDIKPGSWPNPLNANSKGVLPLAVCGTEQFDVTTIDPDTILIGREGFDQWLAPLRWSVEDVATPYDDGQPGGHDLDGDGFPDLALKFSTEELAALLGLGGEPGNTIPLTLTGTLTDEAGGLEFEGVDWIWVLRTGDANLDGIVDIQDFFILKANFAVGAGWSEGDFNEDGIVDIQDFYALKGQFGSGAGVSPLPEPASATLLLIGLPWLTCLAGRRIRRRSRR